MPGATPVIVPELEPTVTKVLLLLHVPPVTPALKDKVVVEVPHKTNVLPEITGVALSVTTCVVVQPEPAVVYVIVLVPGAAPVIVPELEPTVTKVLLLLQVPPVIPALNPNVVVEAPHTINVPLIVALPFTVITAVLPLDGLLVQPVAVFCMWVIVTVVLPALARVDVENVPEPPLMVTDAVSPVAALGALRL